MARAHVHAPRQKGWRQSAGGWTATSGTCSRSAPRGLSGRRFAPTPMRPVTRSRDRLVRGSGLVPITARRPLSSDVSVRRASHPASRGSPDRSGPRRAWRRSARRPQGVLFTDDAQLVAARSAVSRAHREDPAVRAHLNARRAPLSLEGRVLATAHLAGGSQRRPYKSWHSFAPADCVHSVSMCRRSRDDR
jgi:hypothetical protein